MPSDIDALTAGQRARANADARALSAFEPELSEPTRSRNTGAAQADALDLFPREESGISLPRSSSGRVTAIAVPVRSESPQPLAPFIARLVGLALIGLAVGLWSSMQWADNPTSVPSGVAPVPDGVSAPPAPTPHPESPGVVAMREDIRAQHVPPHPPAAASAAGRARAETRPRTAKSRQAPPREPPSATRPTGATTSPPAQPLTTSPLNVAEPASSATAPVNRRDPRDEATPMNPPAPMPADTPVSAPSGLPSATATAAPPAPAPAVARETADIQAALTRYAVAFSDLDPAAVRAVWPNVDSRALTRAFRGLQEQAIVFDRCDISATGTSAAASCDGAVRYVTRIGSRDPRTERRQWQFRMRKVAERWVIESVASR